LNLESNNNNNKHWKQIGGKAQNSRKIRAFHTRTLINTYGRDPSQVDREDLTAEAIWSHLPAELGQGYSFAAKARPLKRHHSTPIEAPPFNTPSPA
jgi:hypothetical protein